MIKAFLKYGLLIVLSVGLTALYFSTFDVAQDSTRVFQTVNPLTTATERRTNQERVPISITQALKTGQLVEISAPAGEIHIQKLTSNSYWILNTPSYSMTLYVGEKECLLVDAPASLFVDRLLEKIEAITPNPVTTLVYTHPHFDHVGGAANLHRSLEKRGIVPRVIASDRFVLESRKYQQPVPQPTEVLPTPRASFSFDNKDFKLVTPVEWGHTGADSYILFPDNVITFVDFVQAEGFLPLTDVSGVQNMRGYINFLRHVMGEDWDYANVGHINVGSKQDVARTLEYFEDLYEAWFEVIVDNFEAWRSLRAKPQGEHVGVLLRNFFDQMATETVLKVQNKWGDQPHFEVARDHALKVAWDGFLNYDFMNHPEIRPDFTPIQPPE